MVKRMPEKRQSVAFLGFFLAFLFPLQTYAGSLCNIYLTIPMKPEYWEQDRTTLNATYLSDIERKVHEIHFSEGQLKWSDGTVLDTGGDSFLFVMDGQGAIFVEHPKYKIPAVHRAFHSSFFAGKPVAMAGTLVAKNGIVESVSTHSGHYAPPSDLLLQFEAELRARNAPVGQLTLCDYTGRPLDRCKIMNPWNEPNFSEEKYLRNLGYRMRALQILRTFDGMGDIDEGSQERLGNNVLLMLENESSESEVISWLKAQLTPKTK